MITPPTDIFWTVRVEDEAAEFVTSTLSLSSMADIKEVVLISDDFNNDIQANITLDDTIQAIASHIESPTIEKTAINPLYWPSSREVIDSVMEGEADSETVAFVGMDGSPFTMKLVDVSIDDRLVIDGKISCKPFELPSYSEIVKNQAELKLQ